MMGGTSPSSVALLGGEEGGEGGVDGGGSGGGDGDGGDGGGKKHGAILLVAEETELVGSGVRSVHTLAQYT